VRTLTARQRRVLEFVVRHAEETGRPPTIREIGAAFGFRSTGTVRDHLRALEAKGALRWERGCARGVTPLRGTPRRRGDPGPGTRDTGSGLPLLGRIAAGRPLLSEEHIEGWLDLPAAAGAGLEGRFALRVTGDSMSGAGILDGDVVVVRRQDTADPGDIVVALVEGEATVKRLRVKGRRPWLEPANPRYRPIALAGEARIAGKVVGVWRAL
jgi:repressor LexA